MLGPLLSLLMHLRHVHQIYMLRDTNYSSRQYIQCSPLFDALLCVSDAKFQILFFSISVYMIKLKFLLKIILNL